MSLSDWAELKVLEHIVGKTSWTMPTTYLALCLAAPGEANSGDAISEVADQYDYARVATSGDWNSASAGQIDNANLISFAEANGGSWGLITHWALMTSPVHGEGYMITWGTLTTPKQIDDADTARFAVGDIVITAD